ncbi:MAG: hypothetical protein JSU04_07540 [Bdellovibrionales bacterium]|nr:hypothetical protein [Bdellovibrionales bacterium]
MKFPVLIAVLLTALNAWSIEQAAYLDVEDDEIVSVFAKPGNNWKTCKSDSTCHPVGWLDNKAKIKIISAPKKMKVEDPYTGKMENEEFVLVDFSYERTVKGVVYKKHDTGWVDASYLSKIKNKTFFGDDNSNSKPERDCPPGDPNQAIIDVKKKMAPVTKAVGNQGVKDIAKSLSEVVGQCVINPAKPPSRYPAGNAFDSMVLPSLQRKMPKILGPDGKPVTLQQVADIDALARTLYGEMAGCYKHGLQYPMAIAKIASNRADAPDKTKKAFIGSDASRSDKVDDIARVVTTPSQFNVWMKYHEGGQINGSLQKALCPPSDPNKASWQNFKPGKDEQAIWENTVRIATEAVLFPNKFKSRTSEIKNDIYDYNSGSRDPWGYTRIYPRIEGRRVDRVSCMQVWKR